MPVLERGCSIAAILVQIAAIADAKAKPIDQRDKSGKGEALLARIAGEVTRQPPPDARQSPPKIRKLVEFPLRLEFGPVGMIAILLPSPLIETGRLKMALGGGADPSILPCRRHGQSRDPRAFLSIRDAVALWIDIGETPAAALARNPGVAIRIIDKPGTCSGGRADPGSGSGG